jgi:hypothetical protein
MALSWSPPAAAAATSQAQFGSSPARPAHARQAVLHLPPLARRIPLLAVNTTATNSSVSPAWRRHALATEVEGLNIADDVTQVTHTYCHTPVRCPAIDKPRIRLVN